MKQSKIFITLFLLASFLNLGCLAQAIDKKKTETLSKTTVENAKSSGDLYIMAGMSKGQAEGLTQALKEAEISSKPILQARALEKDGKLDDAVRAYQAAVRVKRHEGEARLGLSRVYEKQGNYAKAVESLAVALDKNINDWAKPEYTQKLSDLKSKAAAQEQKNLEGQTKP